MTKDYKKDYNKKRILKYARPLSEVIAKYPPEQQAKIHARAKNIRLAMQIKELRKKKNISQYALSKKAGISRSYLRSIENGESTNVGLETLYKIVRAVGAELVMDIETEYKKE
jgi:DNA-binding XRE family transcriptional regulator